MNTALYVVGAGLSLSLLSGCNLLTPPAQMKPLEQSGTYWLNYTSDRRGALVRIEGQGEHQKIRLCAEPVPDTSRQADFNSTLKQGLNELQAEGSSKVVVLPGRDSNVLSMREALYRLCELSLNQQIDSAQLLASYDKVIVTIQAQAQAEQAKAEAEKAAVLKTSAVAVNPYPLAREAELTGFAAIINQDFTAALMHFSIAEELYPGFHNVFEIRNQLKDILADDKVDETKRQALLKRLDGQWRWQIPDSLRKQIKAQITP